MLPKITGGIYAAMPKISSMKATCPTTSPLFNHLTCPLRIISAHNLASCFQRVRVSAPIAGIRRVEENGPITPPRQASDACTRKTTRPLRSETASRSPGFRRVHDEIKQMWLSDSYDVPQEVVGGPHSPAFREFLLTWFCTFARTLARGKIRGRAIPEAGAWHSQPMLDGAGNATGPPG